MAVILIEPYLRPTQFFSEKSTESLPWRNLLFAMGILVSIPFARIALGNLVGAMAEEYFAPHSVIFAFSLWQTPLAAAQQQVLLLPLYAAGMLLYALFIHAMLWLARGKNASYAATLQCVCYAAPCWYLTIFPYSGVPAALVYVSIFLAYSLRATHHTKWSRVLPVIAMGFPVLFIICSLLFP